MKLPHDGITDDWFTAQWNYHDEITTMTLPHDQITARCNYPRWIYLTMKLPMIDLSDVKLPTMNLTTINLPHDEITHDEITDDWLISRWNYPRWNYRRWIYLTMKLPTMKLARIRTARVFAFFSLDETVMRRDFPRRNISNWKLPLWNCLRRNFQFPGNMYLEN